MPEPALYTAAEGPALAREPVMPRLLGFIASLYLASVCFFSTASESVAWVAQAVAIGVAFAWLTIGLIIYGQGITWTKPITLYVGFLVWSLTGYIVTIHAERFTLTLTTTAKVVLITWVMSQCIRTRRDLLICFFMVALTSVVVIALGADEIKRSATYRGDAGDSWAKDRASATLLGNANDLGIYGVTVVISGVFCLLGYRSVLVKGCGVLACAGGMYLVAASGSRTAMLGIAVGTVALYYYHLRQLGTNSMARKVAVFFIAIMLMAGAAYFIAKLPFFFRVREMMTDRGAVEKEPRLIYFFRSLEVVAKNPIFGLGLNGFAMHRLGTNHRGEGQYTHSSISESLSATGLIGFALFYGVYFVLFMQIRRLRKLDIPPKDRATLNMIMAYLLVVVAFSSVAVLFYHRLICPLLGACSGYVWYMEKMYGHRPAAAPQSVAAMS